MLFPTAENAENAQDEPSRGVFVGFWSLPAPLGHRRRSLRRAAAARRAIGRIGGGIGTWPHQHLHGYLPLHLHGYLPLHLHRYLPLRLHRWRHQRRYLPLHTCVVDFAGTQHLIQALIAEPGTSASS